MEIDEEYSENAISFEDAFAGLEQIVRRLESGQTTLDEAVSSFEKGMLLAHICNRKLASTELKVETLRKSFAEDSGRSVNASDAAKETEDINGTVQVSNASEDVNLEDLPW